MLMQAGTEIFLLVSEGLLRTWHLTGLKKKKQRTYLIQVSNSVDKKTQLLKWRHGYHNFKNSEQGREREMEESEWSMITWFDSWLGWQVYISGSVVHKVENTQSALRWR